jgi:hypothetical protein
MKATHLGTLALMALGLAGWEGGCGPRHVPPTDTSTSSTNGGTTGQGGSTGTTGTTGATGGSTGSTSACPGLDESDCTARADCRAVYEPVSCGSDAFVRCEASGVVCPAYACAFQGGDPSWTCTTPVDANGCPGCPVCVPPTRECTADSDCGPSQYCELPGGSGASCGAPSPNTRGTCVDRQLFCQTDADCPAGTACVTPEVNCPPGANCMVPAPTCQPIVVCAEIACAPVDPTWICEPSTDASGCPTCGNCHPSRCNTDSDCGAGFACEHAACPSDLPLCSQIPPGTQPPCCPDEGQCVAQVPTCQTDADCSATEHCLPDPTDPCNGPTVDCFVAGRQTCQSVFCASDADCAAGQACVQVTPVDCPPGADCMVAAMVCENVSQPRPCITDADCSQPGQTCQDNPQTCVGRDCTDPSRSCRAAPGCQSDADCQSGEVCARSDVFCPPNADCATMGAVCVPAPVVHNCGDTDCSADQVCVHSVGGAPGPDGQGLNTYACVALPELCNRVAESACQCAASVCGAGGTSVCGAPIQVTCNLP